MRMRFWKALGGLAAALLGVAALALALWLALSGGRLKKEPEGTLVRRVHVPPRLKRAPMPTVPSAERMEERYAARLTEQWCRCREWSYIRRCQKRSLSSGRRRHERI